MPVLRAHEPPRALPERLIPLLPAALGAASALSALGLGWPGALNPTSAALVLAAGAAAAVGPWRRLRTRFGSPLRAALPFAGLWPLVLALAQVSHGDAPERTLLAVAVALSLGAVAALAWLAGNPGRGGDHGLWPCLLVTVIAIDAAVSAVAGSAVFHRHGFWGRDEAVFAQSLWSSLHGAFFRNSLEGPWVSHFAIHNSPLLLVWWPFYRLLPRLETVIALNSVAAAAAAWPLYLLARVRLPRLPSTLLAAGWLAHPFVLGATTLTVSEAAWTALPLAVALLGVERQRPPLVLAGAFGLLLVQEYLGLACVAIGLLAAARGLRRTAIVTAIAGIAWLALTLWVVFPRFGSAELAQTGFTCRYGHLGRTPGEVVRRIAAHPVEIAAGQLATHRRWIHYALSPAGLALPLLAPAGWAALVPMGAVLLQGAAMSPAKFCAWPVFLFAALPSACARLARGIERMGRPGAVTFDRVALVAAAAGVVTIASGLGSYHGWAFYRGPQMDASRRAEVNELLAAIPPRGRRGGSRHAAAGAGRTARAPGGLVGAAGGVGAGRAHGTACRLPAAAGLARVAGARGALRARARGGGARALAAVATALSGAAAATRQLSGWRGCARAGRA